ncbi:helix-turn-helix domain-containing protein, partial [Rhizobium leguminosarum]
MAASVSASTKQQGGFDLVTFARAARLGSFSAAAEESGITH